MINVIDEVLNTGATDNKVKYKIKHADSTEEIVEIELATPVATQGTALNKLLFDSIQADITHLTPIAGSYTGNGSGTNSNFANLGYVPKLVIIYGIMKDGYAGLAVFLNNGNYSSIFSGSINSDNTQIFYFKDTNGAGDSRQTLSVTTNGFTFTGGNSTIKPMNINGNTYSYIIFK